MTVAETILHQLGGRRFIVMTGAKNFVGLNDGLSLKLPSNFASKGINHLRITLNAMDTYDIVFNKLRGMKLTLINTVEGVYAEDLRRIIADETGLSLSL